MSQRSATGNELPAARLRIIDGTSISRAGDDGTTWRIHASFDPATTCFSDLQITGADVGEGFARFSFKPGDLAVGDRFYAKPPGLQHVLRSGADFLVRVGWNSMRMATTDGARLDFASIYARMAPGETSEVPVFVTGGSKGRGHKPRRLFPARLIVFRQQEEASTRAIRAAKRQHSRKRSGMALQPMTLSSARFLMVLTSLPASSVAASAVLAAYRLRWQVELAFKRLKSGLGIHRLTARDPTIARSWLLAHLILALMIEDGASEVLDSPPCT
ncbi:MAG: transposase [Thermohalobaculum sp.]